MKPVSGKRLCEALEERGWTLDRKKGSHHIFSHPDSTLNVSVPVHRNEDLPTGTQRRIMRDAGLTDADL